MYIYIYIYICIYTYMYIYIYIYIYKCAYMCMGVQCVCMHIDVYLRPRPCAGDRARAPQPGSACPNVFDLGGTNGNKW